MAWTYIAQRAVTGEFLDWDLPLEVSGLEWALSGPGSLKATVTPDVGGLKSDDGHLILEEWGTLIHAEADGEIRWSGIVITSSFEGENWQIEAAGLSTYAHSITYEDEFSRIGIDPIDAFKEIWRHVQSYANSNLGITITGSSSTGLLLGTPAGPDQIKAEDGTLVPIDFYGPVVPDGAQIEKGEDAKPYELLWWEHPNCGEEAEALAKQTPFDYVERHRWAPDHESIIHEIEVAYPRFGRRRDDLIFVQGDNIIGDPVVVDSNGDEFANVITGLGAGEGRAMLRRQTQVTDGRLRRESTYADKAITDSGRLDSIIASELADRSATIRVSSIEVTDHEFARLGDWEIGDDVLVRLDIPWLGEVDIWCRITAWSLTGNGTATLTLARSDFFTYGGAST